jgi:hypothetical protein
MRKTIWTGAFGTIIGIAAVAIAAQQPAPAQSSGASADRRITVTGCLKEAPSSSAAAVGTTGTTGAAGAPADAAAQPKFVLSDATAASADAAGAPGAAPQTYQLVANPAGLSPHVGKKLELTGTLEAPSASASAASSPALRVESGKIVAATCSE